MSWKSVGWGSATLIFTGLAWAQEAAPNAIAAGDSRLNLWLTWALVWVPLAVGLCIVLFKLYSYWPNVERWLALTTLVALPPVLTALTTSHVSLLGELLPRGRGGIEYTPIFAFWVVVVVCFGAAWRLVKTKSNWLPSLSEPLAAASIARSSAPDSKAPQSIDPGSSGPHARRAPQIKSMGSESKAESRANATDATIGSNEAPAPSTMRRSPVNFEQARVPERKPDPKRVETDSIFISYRRQDSADATGRIYDRLLQSFDRKQVFKDVDSIPLGVDFRAHLGDVVGRCSLLLAIIGPQWLNVNGPNGRRLDDAGDFVRIEIEAALARNIPVIPLLVGGAELPSERELPPSLAAITFRNGIAVRPDPDFHRDMDRLISGLDSLVRLNLH